MLTIEEVSVITDGLKTNQERVTFLASLLDELTTHHQDNCEPYRKFVSSFFENYQASRCLEQIPFVPIGLFKQMELKSVPQPRIVRTLESSGTSGSTSKIFLDKITAINQIKVLTNLFHKTVSTEKIPMIVIDYPQAANSFDSINARIAAIKGFKIFSSETHFLLNEELDVQTGLLRQIQESFGDSEVFFFGFTFVIWKEFLLYIEKEGIKMDFPKATLIHGGGWKKLTDLEVSNEDFKASVKKNLGIKNVVNYYGMAEQTGSLYFECQASNLHTTAFGHVVIRSFRDLSVCRIGEIGIVQLLSIIPRSYPGHSILTEDVGFVLGDDGCGCGKPGRYFKVIGRVPDAEIRGCSDAYGNS